MTRNTRELENPAVFLIGWQFFVASLQFFFTTPIHFSWNTDTVLTIGLFVETFSGHAGETY